MNLAKNLLAAGAMVLSAFSAQADEVRLKTATAFQLPTYAFSLGLKNPGVSSANLADNIESQLVGKTVGFAYAIAKNGRLVEQGQGGFARVPMLDGSVPFTVNTDVNVFSVSKPITAIATLQLMEKLGIHPNDPISDWLPVSWSKGYGFTHSGITFRDLLTHRTGIQQTIGYYLNELPGFSALSSNTWQGLKEIVENGIVDSWGQKTCASKPEGSDEFVPGSASSNGGYFGVYCYKNANYALARILIWQMALATGDLNANNELAADMDSASGYQHYVRHHVLQPAGVDGFCYRTGPENLSALAYDINQHLIPLMVTRGGSMGGSFPGGLLTCGPKNWWLSAMDLAAVMAHLHFGDLLSDTYRGYMDDYELGWSRSSDSASKPDRYWHGGLGKWTRNNQLQLLYPQHPANPTQGFLPKSVTTKTRVRTCVMKFPGGLDATLVMNSDVRNSSKDACGVLNSAFDSI
ncbi:MAG: beta-lactamase family protein [Pseudomonadales bacterium]|nr:beta-lactamase family protein [Pseudomonadales bacterium]